MSAEHEFVLFVVGLALIVFSWRLIHQTLADMARDSLFELRDCARLEFSSRNALSSKTYSNLRLLLNGYLVNLDQMSIGSVIIWGILNGGNAAPSQRKIAVDVPKELEEMTEYIIARANRVSVRFTLFNGFWAVPVGLPALLAIGKMHAWRRKSSKEAIAKIEPEKFSKVGIPQVERPVASITQSWAKESANRRVCEKAFAFC